MNPVNEIIQKVRDLTVSKQKQLIGKRFQITLTDEPSNHATINNQVFYKSDKINILQISIFLYFCIISVTYQENVS